ncbi:uncharacterized protein LOC144134840 [Amblyomma americanum]
MNSSQHFNWLIVLVAVLASMTVVPPVNAQDCRQSSQDCNAKQVLSNFPVFNVYVTSDPEPKKYCERYDRTSLSDDGTTAEYDVVYRDANGDDTPISDTSTFDVTNNTVIYVTYGNDRSTVYRFTLDYVNKDQCFVGHCNCTETQYYLFDSPDSDIFQYHECLKKIDNYSGGNITFLRDLQKCQKIPPKP